LDLIHLLWRCGISSLVVEPEWDGETMHLMYAGTWRVVGVLFFSWLPLVMIAVQVAERGLAALGTLDAPMIFVAVFWSLFLYCWCRAHRFSIHFDRRSVVESTRHLVFWQHSHTALNEDAKLVLEYSYGPILGKVSAGLYGPTLYVKLRLVSGSEEWALIEQPVTPPGEPFALVRSDALAMAERIADGLGGLQVEDHLDDAKHLLVLPAQPVQQSQPITKESPNSTLGCIGFSIFAVVLSFVSLIWAVGGNFIAAVFFAGWCLLMIYLGLRKRFWKHRWTLDPKQRTLSVEQGWVRLGEPKTLPIDGSARLVIYRLGGKSRNQRHPSHGLCLVSEGGRFGVPGAKTNRLEDVLAHAAALSGQLGLSMELSGAMVIERYRKLNEPSVPA